MPTALFATDAQNSQDELPAAMVTQKNKSRPTHLLPSSPHRASPLSQSFGPDLKDDTVELEATTEPNSLKTRHHRRRSSTSGLLSQSSGVAAGSYVTSLLSGRMTTPPSAPTSFTLHLGVNPLEPCPKSLLGLPHLKIPFGASWYELDGPYSSSISLPQYYADRRDDNTRDSASSRSQKVRGYRIPPKGKFQLLIANGQGTPVKHFLIPYDLLDMKYGEQTIYRQLWNSRPLPVKSTSTAIPLPLPASNSRETLRYAVELHFVAPPSKPSKSPPIHQPSSSSAAVASQLSFPTPALDGFVFEMDMDAEVQITDPSSSSTLSQLQPASSSQEPLRSRKPKIYLSSIRLAFASHTPDDDEVLTSSIEWCGPTGRRNEIDSEGRAYFPYSSSN